MAHVQRYGNLPAGAVERELVRAGVADRYDPGRPRELTKLVLRPDLSGAGLGRAFFRAAHSRDFLQCGEEPERVFLACARRSIFRAMFDALNINTRFLAPFPIYRVHERYRSDDDPMESHLIIPALDIPASIYNQPLPTVLTAPPATSGPSPTQEVEPRLALSPADGHRGASWPPRR